MSDPRLLRALTFGLVLFGLQGTATNAATLTKHLNIQPVLICENAYSGTCTEPELDVGLVDAIYAQIGVRTSVKPFITVTDLDLPRTVPSYLTGAPGSVDGEPANGAFGGYVVNAGLAPNTAYIGAVGPTMTLFGMPAQGVAKIGDDGFPFGLFINNSARTDVASLSEKSRIARLNAQVVAHEVGHMLGGRHDLAPPRGTYTHLLEPRSYYPPEGYVPMISAGNAALMQASSLLDAIGGTTGSDEMPEIGMAPQVAHAPLPAPVLMLLAAIGWLTIHGRIPEIRRRRLRSV